LGLILFDDASELGPVPELLAAELGPTPELLAAKFDQGGFCSVGGAFPKTSTGLGL